MILLVKWDAVRSNSNVWINVYFLKMKYTASIKNPNPIKWFVLNVSSLKKKSVKAVNTTNVITSWITFSCHRLKGPPFPENPILFAGTCAEYSKSAMPHAY